MEGKRRYSTVYFRSTKLLTVLLIVGLALTSLAGTALAQDDPSLFIDDNTDVYLYGSANSFWVPVRLETAQDISSVAFGLNYDASCLSFDSLTDSNNDGVPDSVKKLHSGFTYEVRHDAVTGEVVVVARANTQDANGLPVTMDLVFWEKKVTELRFDVLPACRTTNGQPVQTNFTFVVKLQKPRLPSISDNLGNSLAQPPLIDHVIDGAYFLYFNAAPTAVFLNNGTEVNFAENQVAGTVVGTLSNNDPDPTDTHTYTFDSCVGNDNFAFKIVGDELRAAGPYNYEDASVLGGDHSFNVCVTATDRYGAAATGAFIVHVTDVNEAPQDIQLDNTLINEMLPAGSPVGTLTTLGDPDSPESHTYALPASPPPTCPGTHNASFQIVGDELRSAEIFNVETQDLYLVCISSTDTGPNVIYRAFTIEIDDENEAPVAVNDPDSPVILANTGASHTFYVLTNDTDPEGDPLKIGSVTQPPIGGSVIMVGAPPNGIQFTPAVGYSGPVQFTYQAREDTGWAELDSNFATVSFYVVNDEDRGDCNNDGEIDAADFSATQLEMWDDADPLLWTEIYLGNYAGSPVGCDSNSSRNGLDGTQEAVDISDVTCTVRLFFGEVCAPIMSGAIGEPSAGLKVGSGLRVASGGSVQVPIILDTAGQTIASAGFWVEYDANLFSVDADSVTLNLPEGVVQIVDVNTPGLIKVAAFGISLPFPLLQDGVIANITLNSKASFVGQSPVVLVENQTSLSTDGARSIPVNIDDGFVTLGGPSLFLPLLQMP